MIPIAAELTVKSTTRPTLSSKAAKLRFSANHLFLFDGRADEVACLQKIANFLLSKNKPLALLGSQEFIDYLLTHAPELKRIVQACLPGNLDIQAIPEKVQTIFIAETLSLPAWRLLDELKTSNRSFDIYTPEILTKIDFEAVPERAWRPAFETIYPMSIPDIQFLPNQDLVLIDCPARNLALMPNGLAYVHNALKKTNIKFQTVDIDILVYHRYHVRRLFDAKETLVTESGHKMLDDPWQAEAYDEWQKADVIEFFRPEINEVVQKIVQAKPKILGLSIHACNVRFSREVVNGVKAALPDTVILVGGFSCYQPTIGRRAFPECDYMTIGEADLSVGALVEALARGERPKNIPGVLSRYDSPDYVYQDSAMPHELDKIEMPKYEWFDLKLYRNFNHYQLTPIIASRGCRWSKCTFCAERFFWRVRSPQNVVDEFEWLNQQGCDLFMFNESDLNGLPEVLLQICDEIIRRGLKIKLTGQLRINKKSDRAFFEKLHKAGFVALRFGVDAWSVNGLRQQMKGYTPEMIYQNLKDCWEVGIYTEVNTVIGVPGETEADMDESIELITRCKPYIGRAANINTLMLVIGSVYWENPEKFNIVFHGDKNELFEKYPMIIPENLWHSEKPYIDGPVRKARFVKFVKALHQNGFAIGDFAKQVIRDVEAGKGADHSARPDFANENDMKTKKAYDSQKMSFEVYERDAAPNSKIQSPEEIKKTFQVIRYGDEFYSVDPAIPLDKKSFDDHLPIRKESSLETTARLITENSKNLIANRQHFSNGAAKVWSVLKREGFLSLTRKVRKKLTRQAEEKKLVVDANEYVQIKKDYTAFTTLLFEGFHGYNFLKVLYDYYAIQQGHPFDKDVADRGQYTEGVCFKSHNVKDLEKQVLRHLEQVGGPARLLIEGFHGYNILEAGIHKYGILQGHPFEANPKYHARYPKNVLVKGSTIEEVQNLILSHLAADEVSLKK